MANDFYDRAKSYGIASLILGIIALFFSMTGALGIVGFICAIVGLVLGSKARRRLPEDQRTMATAGWICSIVALCLASLGILFFFGFLGLLGLGAIFS